MAVKDWLCFREVMDQNADFGKSVRMARWPDLSNLAPKFFYKIRGNILGVEV